MKQGLIGGSLAAAVLLASVIYLRGQGAAAPAADPKEKRTINTTGTATIRVKPDSARVFFGVESLAKSLKDARGDNSKRSKTVIDALNALKIPNMRMKTSDMVVNLEKRLRNSEVLQDIVGYRVTHTFTVVVQNTDQEKLGALARQVLDTALENGANLVEHISFFKEEDKQVRREALAKAVEDAVANAKALAAGGKVDLGHTVAISGQPDYHYGGRQQLTNTMQTAMPGDSEAPLVAGDLLVTCTASVTCTY
jgi:uncharacterized protein YggE